MNPILTELLRVALPALCIACGMLVFLNEYNLYRLGKIQIRFPGGAVFRLFSPNWLTVWGSVGVLLGFYLFAGCGMFALGFNIVVVGALLDRLDGKSAHALGRELEPYQRWRVSGLHVYACEHLHGAEERLEIELCQNTTLSRLWAVMNYPGRTAFGKLLDSTLDKCNVLSIQGYFAYAGVLPVALVLLLAFAEMVNIAMRLPIPSIQRQITDRAASGIGKIKVLAEWTVIILCGFFLRSWADGVFNLYLLQGLCILLAFGSAVSRLKIAHSVPLLRRFFLRTTEELSHGKSALW